MNIHGSCMALFSSSVTSDCLRSSLPLTNFHGVNTLTVVNLKFSLECHLTEGMTRQDSGEVPLSCILAEVILGLTRILCLMGSPMKNYPALF